MLIKAKEQGYFIRCFYFLTVNPLIDVQRVNSRVEDGGHDVPEEKIKSRYEKALSLIPELVDVCDSLNIWDNSTETPYRIFRKKKDKFDIFKNPIWSNEEIEKLVNMK